MVETSTPTVLSAVRPATPSPCPQPAADLARAGYGAPGSVNGFPARVALDAAFPGRNVPGENVS